MTDKVPRCPPYREGDREYRVFEKQLYCLMQGWTHTSLSDPKGILQTIAEDNPLYDDHLPPCPKCGSTTFCANIDNGWQILCTNDACKWKQKIVAEPVPITDEISCLVCFYCGKPVSTHHRGLIFRGIATCPECTESGKDIDPEHDASIRKEERERVLDVVFEGLLQKRFETGLSQSYIVWSADMEDLIESLRTHQPPEHKRGQDNPEMMGPEQSGREHI